MTTESQVGSVLSQVAARYPDMAKRDIMNALRTFKDLHAQPDSFTFADGVKRPVLSLNGTLPVLYRGSTYNIPVCLYLLDTHPYHAPVCYVRPTQQMTIKASQHLDTAGRIYLPYLAEWQQGKCDLLGLLQIMVLVFQDHCPVFARGSSSNTSASGYPPYPVASGGGPYPAYPPYPGPAQSNASYSSPPYSSYGSTPYPPPGGFSNQSSQSSTSSGTIQPEHIRASMMSAIQDALRKNLRDTLGRTHAELQSVRNTREELDRGQHKLKQMLDRLGEEKASLESGMAVYEEKVGELDRLLAAGAAEEQPDIDQAVDTTAPLFRQLIKCFVEDNAIEDAIYYLSQALKRAHLDLDTYLRHVRKMSRQQFMLRATMHKCREKAGLTV